jgi:type II secretory pathway pseudopilin PulG
LKADIILLRALRFIAVCDKENKMRSKGQIVKMAYAKTGFTIIELLTIISIIVIIIGVLLPGLNMIRWYAKYTTQKNLFRNIDTGLQAYEIDFGEYPDSSATDATGAQYCGAMKLAEAMAGQDGLGFNPDSKFTADDGSGNTELYPPSQGGPGSWPDWYKENLRNRKEYLEAKDVQICSLDNLYASASGFTFTNEVALLCDVYKRNEIRNSKGTKLGMPILYYKADTSKLVHDVNVPTNPGNTYNYLDNHKFLSLGVRWDPAVIHQLYKANSGPPLYTPTGAPEGQVFYKKILDESALPILRPYNKNSYILISAGGDGIYGTGGSLKTKDVFNFAD